jgi:ABC-type transport system involved in multi-copper enzyme maturation permease subunit
MRTLVRVEIERSLRRRMVWVLLAVALVGIALFGFLAFVTSTHLRVDEAHPSLVRTWWGEGGGDSPLTVGAVFLLLGGLIGGAGVVGGEWRAGNVATVLTWEPRRGRLLAARLIAIAACAFVLAIALQALFLAAAVPAVVAHGTVAGAGRALAAAVALAALRVAALTSVAALVGASGAWVTRNTAAAIVIVWGWLAIGESILRANRPGAGAFLIGENLSRVLLWDDLGARAASHVGPVHATVLLTAVVIATATVAAVVFARTDATSA